MIVSAPFPPGQASTGESVFAAKKASRSEQSLSLFSSSTVVLTSMVVGPLEFGPGVGVSVGVGSG